MACAALAGFISLSHEILWYRVYAFGTGGTLPVFGIFLGIYLTGMAVGALLAQRLCRETSADACDRIARWAGLLVAAAGAIAYLHVPLAAWFAEHRHVAGAMPFAGLTAGLYGAVLPLAGHAAVPPDSKAGRGVSRVYLANIIGSCLGSVLTGFVFLEYLGVADASLLLLIASAAAALLLLRGIGSAWAGGATHCAAVLALAAAAFLYGSPRYEALYERLLWRTPSGADHPFSLLVENRAGVVAVTAAGTVFGSGVYDGKLNVVLARDSNMIYRAYALAGLHPNPRRVLMIGLGSGSWAQVVAHHPRLERLVIVEINPGYLEVLRRYEEVHTLLGNPKVKIVIDDGRRWLGRATDARYDVILSNASFHWRANSSHILSAQFLELAASRLAPGGIVYFNTTGSPAAARTACASFASGLRFANFMAVGNGQVAFNAENFQAVLRAYRIDGRRPFDGPAAPWLAANLPRLLSPDLLESCASVLARTETARIITDDNLASEAAVPWNFSFRPPDLE